MMKVDERTRGWKIDCHSLDDKQVGGARAHETQPAPSTQRMSRLRFRTGVHRSSRANESISRADETRRGVFADVARFSSSLSLTTGNNIAGVK